MVGDPIGKLWIPYAGVRFTGRKCLGTDCCGRPCTEIEYKWRVIGSIIAWNKFRDPLNINCSSPTLIETSRTLYSMDGNQGYFLETEGQTFLPITRTLDAYAWVMGSWLKVTGPGDIDATIVPGLTSPPGDPYTDIFGGRPGSGDTDDASFIREYYALGLGFRLAF